MKLTKTIVATVSTLLLVTSAFADEAYDIVKKSTSLPVPDTSTAMMMLYNIEKNGAIEEMPMIQHGRSRDGGLVDTVFEIQGPAKKKNTRVLQQERDKRADDRWIYLPELKSTRRIPIGDRYKSFVGCEFTYNDMGVRHVDEDKHEMLDTNVTVTVPGGKTYTCWKIKSVPYKKSDIEYSYRIQYIDKESYLPAKIEYFEKKDNSKLLKTYTTEDWFWLTSKTGKKYAMRMKARIVTEKTGRQTLLEIKNPVMDGPMPAGYFTQQYLQSGKAK